MIVGLNALGELRADEVSDQGHQRLKPAEPQAHHARLFPIDFSHGQALADRNREGVHGKTHGQQQ